jgi:hypothetical protein
VHKKESENTEKIKKIKTQRKKTIEKSRVKQEERRTEQKSGRHRIQKAKPSFVFVPGFKQNRQTKKNKKTEGSGFENKRE